MHATAPRVESNTVPKLQLSLPAAEPSSYLSPRMWSSSPCAPVAPALWQHGPAPGALHGFPGPRPGPQSPQSPQSRPGDIVKHDFTPATTGTSIIALKFNKGVIMAADMLVSYGSMARYRNMPRLVRLNSSIVVGAGGDFADYQYMRDIMERKIIDEKCLDDGMQLKPKSLHCWLTRVLYNRRSKFDPIWNNYVVGGVQDGVPFLGAVDMIGTAYESDCIGTGFGAYFAVPLMREYTDQGKEIDEAKAREIMARCMEVLYYRDGRSFPKYQIAVITAEGSRVEEPVSVKENWEIAHMVKDYK